MSSNLLHNLGVDIPSDVLTSNPKFANLLASLSETLGKDGESKSVTELSNTIKATLTTKKETYFFNYILFNEIRDILLDRKLQLTPNSTEDSLWELFIDSNCKEILSSLDKNTKIFGLEEKDFECNPNQKKITDSTRQMLRAKLESRLREMFETVAAIYQLPSNERGGHSAPNPTNLHVLVERDLGYVKCLRKHLSELKTRNLGLLDRYCDCLVRCAALLSEVLSERRVRSVPEQNAVTVEWLVSHCDALYSKMRMLELQLLQETYDAETLAALSVIRKELMEKTEKTRRELKQAKALLGSYSSLGDRFKAVVAEYSRVKTEIENRKWALKQLED